MDSTMNPKVKTMEFRKSWGVLLGEQHFRGRRVCWNSKMGLGQVTSGSIIHMDLHKTNNKLISAKFEHFWCTNEPWANTDYQDSPHPELGGSHHLPPYSIFYA